MPNKTFQDGLQQTRDNLMVMAQEAVNDSVKTLPYVEVQGNAFPTVDFVVTGANYQKTGAGTQTFTVNMRMRVTVDQVLAGFEGNRQQDAYFHYLPTVLQYFAEHPNMFTRGGTRPPYLDPENTAINTATVTIEDGKIIIVLNWGLAFNTSFQPLC